jgi:DNA-directed RNA polymerase subunit K/omega
MSKNQHLSVEDCYARGTSPFRTVIMAAQEARFINEQANLGFIKLSEKPTTIAIHKFKNRRLAVVEETPVEAAEEAPLAE